MQDWLIANLLAWMEQMCVLGAAGSALLVLFRIRHPWSKLAYCRTLLAICLLLPLLLPWIEPRRLAPAGSAWSIPHTRLILWLLAAGGAAKLVWLLAGLWRIRLRRISSMPLYPIPDSVRAASAVTHADAVFCVSEDLPGPVMLGWLNPVVLLPEAFLSLEEDAQCGVACHELLHVRRHDWLVTVIEELAGALLWFNPAVWPLLAQTRLAREQLVDAEVVRLTAAREPYIDALLAIARGGSGLDLAPAPLFLRRRHLTQRIHLLLKDTATSKLRLASSYASMAVILGMAGWLGALTFPLTGRAAPLITVVSAPSASSVTAPAPTPPPAREASVEEPPAEKPSPRYTPSAPVPTDPHELVIGGAHTLETAAEIATARALMERAQRNAVLAAPSMSSPYRFEVSFTASPATAAGNVERTGRGTLTEIWMPKKKRWTAELDGFSVTRWTDDNWTVEDQHSAVIPLRVETLRDAIYWVVRVPLGGPKTKAIRSAEAVWNGKPAECLLFSNWTGAALLTSGRLWEETEYCFDPASGVLLIDSIAPGTYTVFDYEAALSLRGRPMADRITIYTGGAVAADARFSIAEMSAADEALLAPEPGIAAAGPLVSIEPPARVPLNTPNPSASSVIQPVIVEAEIDRNGNVVEEELCAAADPALAQMALDLVKQTRFKHRAWTQYQLYVNVKFMPSEK